MRNFLWIALVLVACNSNDSTSNATNGDTANNKKEEEKTSGSGGGACSRMVFFQPGAEVEAKSYNAAGEEISSQHTKILDVKNEGGMTVAYVEASDLEIANNKTIDVKYNYKCDGKNIYFDIASMFRTAAKERDAKFEASTIEYPIDVSAGQTLPDATGTMSTEKDGKKMTMKFRYKDRKVDAKEDVTTPAGTWSCYKISNAVQVEMDIPGMDDKTKKMMQSMQSQMKTTSITWFAPDFGIVKMEMYQNGKLQSRNEVTAVKK